MFFDIQINGSWGVDFNSDLLTQEQWDFANARLALDGTRYYLPTIITDEVGSMIAKVERLARLIEAQSTKYDLPDELPGGNRATSRPLGIHIEGPFISREPGYVGAHPPEHAIPANVDVAKQLIQAGRGWVKLVTLAPEQDPGAELTSYLTKQGICVAAGHTNATRDQLLQAIEAGLQLFTHLGNGCPATLPRHDNILNRVLSLQGKISVSFIADGHHLPLWLLNAWIGWFGIEQVSIISDAISAAGLSPGLHSLGKQTVWVGEDGVPRSKDRSHFVGSGTTLGKMNGILKSSLNIIDNDRNRMLLENPARLIFGEDWRRSISDLLPNK